MPSAHRHGDAAPNNMLPGPTEDDVLLIDFQFFNALPVAFDLGQLLVGEVQIGRGGTEAMAETEAAIVPAYVEGLRAEGCDLPEAVVRRAPRAPAGDLLRHLDGALEMLQTWDHELASSLLALAHDRAVLARFSLDLLDAT